MTHARNWVIIKAPAGTNKKSKAGWKFHRSGDMGEMRRVARCMNNEGKYVAKAVMRKNLGEYGL